MNKHGRGPLEDSIYQISKLNTTYFQKFWYFLIAICHGNQLWVEFNLLVVFHTRNIPAKFHQDWFGDLDV